MFDSTEIELDENNYPRGNKAVDAEFFAKYLSHFFGNGVFYTPDDNFKVVPGSGLTIKQKPGAVFINGYFAYDDAEMEETLVASAAVSTNYYLVLQLDLQDGEITRFWRTTNALPVRTSAIWEMVIARVTVPANATEINESEITDYRNNPNYCGIVNTVSPTTDDLESQINNHNTNDTAHAALMARAMPKPFSISFTASDFELTQDGHYNLSINPQYLEYGSMSVFHYTLYISDIDVVGSTVDRIYSGKVGVTGRSGYQEWPPPEESVGKFGYGLLDRGEAAPGLQQSVISSGSNTLLIPLYNSADTSDYLSVVIDSTQTDSLYISVDSHDLIGSITEFNAFSGTIVIYPATADITGTNEYKALSEALSQIEPALSAAQAAVDMINQVDGEDLTEAILNYKASLESSVKGLSFDTLVDRLNASELDVKEKTSYGVVSGLSIGSVDVGGVWELDVMAGVVYTPAGVRYSIPAIYAGVPVNPPDDTYDRIDIIYVSSAGEVICLAGTPAETPVQPATPTGGVLLATLLVQTTDTSPSSANITNNPKRLGRTEWITPTLINGATSVTSYPVQYAVYDNGIVRFRGRLSVAPSGVASFVMPSTCRPTKTTDVICATGSSVNFVKCTFYPSGNFINPTSFTDYLSLNGTYYSIR